MEILKTIEPSKTEVTRVYVLFDTEVSEEMAVQRKLYTYCKKAGVDELNIIKITSGIQHCLSKTTRFNCYGISANIIELMPNECTDGSIEFMVGPVERFKSDDEYEILKLSNMIRNNYKYRVSLLGNLKDTVEEIVRCMEDIRLSNLDFCINLHRLEGVMEVLVDHLVHRDLNCKNRNIILCDLLQIEYDDTLIKSYKSLISTRSIVSLNGGMYLDSELVEDLKAVLPNVVRLCDKIVSYFKTHPDTLVKCIES